MSTADLSRPETIARAESAIGEVVLRRRGPHTELIVDGAFVMDTVDVSTEVELARLALERLVAPRRVLVGGLGLGFTARTVLADERVAKVTVAEIAAPLVDWARAGLLPGDGMRDPRLALRVSDVAVLLADSPQEWDLVLLDVDNGPGFLVREENAGLYADAGLAIAARALRPGGVLAIWSSHRAPELIAGLVALGCGPAEEVRRTVERDGRVLEYALYLLTRDAGGIVGPGR